MDISRITGEQNRLAEAMRNSQYAPQRKSTTRQAVEIMVPLAALAAGAYALHRGTKWGAKELVLKNLDDWSAVKDRLHNLHQESRGSVLHQIMGRLK
jgi:hypothetical protein